MKTVVNVCGLTLGLSLFFASPFGRQAGAEDLSALAQGTRPKVVMKTTMGDITIELFDKEAPMTVENFLQYVDDKFYNGTIFHRVINGFMIQGGGLTRDLVRRETRSPIENEANNGLKNTQGTIVMARTSEANSATAQFFINVVDNPSLDHTSKTPSGYGYCVFGQVIEGMDVVDRIKAVPTTSKNGRRNVPVDTVAIIEISRVN